MSNFTQLVFTNSLILSLIVGSIAGLLLHGKRERTWLLHYVIVGALVHLLWWAWPLLPSAVTEVTRWVFAVWVGIVVAATALLPLFGMAQIIARVRGKPKGLVVPAIYAGISSILGILLVLGGVPLRVREEIVLVSNLDPRLDGFRIANLGDVHIDRFIGPSDLRKAVGEIATRNVNVLAITGDLIDDHRLIEPTLDALDDQRIPAIVAVIGNHEKMGELTPIIRAYKNRRERVSLLSDSSTSIRHAGAKAHFVGIDYAMASGGGHMLTDTQQNRMMAGQAETAFPEVAAGEPVIALSHHPEFFPFAASRGAQLTLSSHTHGGQVALFGRPIFNAYDYMAGRYEADDKHLDVSAGFGHWLPLRLGISREVVIVTLRRVLSD